MSASCSRSGSASAARSRRAFDLQADAALRRRIGCERLQQGTERHPLQRHGHARLRPGECEQAARDPRQAGRVALDVREEVVAFARTILRSGLQHLHRRRDRRQRRPELMRRVPDELVQGPRVRVAAGDLLDDEHCRLRRLGRDAGDAEEQPRVAHDLVGDAGAEPDELLRHEPEAWIELGAHARRVVAEQDASVLVREHDPELVVDADDSVWIALEETVDRGAAVVDRARH